MKPVCGSRALRAATIILALWASMAHAGMGAYRSHAVDGQTLTVATERGQLRITAVNDAAFAVHYIEDGIEQLPSYALADNAPPVTTAVHETDTSVSFAIDGLIAVVNKSPLRIDYASNGQALVSEADGYFANDAARGFSFRLDPG